MTTAAPVTSTRLSRRVFVPLTLAVGAIVGIAANSIVAFAAISAGANPSFAPLTIAVYAPFTILGLVAGYIGWRLVRRGVNSPRRVLTVLVPVLLVLSFAPDTIALLIGFIPGGSVTGFVGLMIMHVIVVAIGVPIYQRLAPVH